MNVSILFAYGVLAVATVLMLTLAIANWRRLGGVEHLLMAALLYYYSLYGAWNILSIKQGIGHSDALDHLEGVLFRLVVDEEYVLTLILYATFNVLILASIWLIAGPQSRGFRAVNLQAVSIPRALLVTMISVWTLIGSAAALWAQIIGALSDGVPIYLFTRSELSEWWTVHQLLNRCGLVSLAFAWPMHLQGQLAPKYRRSMGMALSALTIAWVSYLGVLGNRNELVVATIASVYFHLLTGGRIRWTLLGLLAFLAFLTLRTIETLRAVPSEQLVEHFAKSLVDPEFWNPAALAGGSESLAAHVSLYGVISHSLPWSWGGSIIYIMQSLIPGYPKDMRVSDSYSLYADAIGAPTGQGFNIHFAAGSYLNFGAVGVVLAALVIAVAYSVIRFVAARLQSSPSAAYGVLMGYAFFCAFLPVGMRSGPEGMKALLFEGFVLPFLVTWCCSRRKCVLRQSRVFSSATN